jgi:VCBS repeat-containing protein
VINSNTADGSVVVQANDGNGNVINITVPVTNDASIYGVSSYQTATSSTITTAN